MPQVHVRASRRAKSYIRSYRGHLKVTKARSSPKAARNLQESLHQLRVKYDAGFRKLGRQGYDFRGFSRRLVRKSR